MQLAVGHIVRQVNERCVLLSAQARAAPGKAALPCCPQKMVHFAASLAGQTTESAENPQEQK